MNEKEKEIEEYIRNNTIEGAVLQFREAINEYISPLFGPFRKWLSRLLKKSNNS